jgi:hypothetical protein
MNGKGSKRRPRQVSQEEFDKNWDLIFSKRPKPTALTRWRRHLNCIGTDKCQINLETKN